MAFKKAAKSQAKLRMALMGPPGSGKTFSALSIASGLGSRIAVIDSERGSASKYAGRGGFEFDVCELEDFGPESYIKNIREAESAGFDVLIVDSLSHAWAGPGGVLDIVDQAKKRGGGNDFSAWKSGTPLQNKLIDALLRSKCHIICTMRSKVEYVLEKNESGKNVPKKVGMAPVQRQDVEFEFDVAGTLSNENELVIDKSRCPAISGKSFLKPGVELGRTLKAWLEDGDPVAEAPSESSPLADKVAGAQDVADLEKLLPELKATKGAELESLRALYLKRKAELATAQAS